MVKESKYFMWEHQHNTQSEIQRYAEMLFGNISPKLNPQVFLLGILRGKRDDRLPICIEPENCGVNVELFRDVDTMAKLILEKDSRRCLYVSEQWIRNDCQRAVEQDSVCNAVQQIIEQNSNRSTISFVSRSVNVEDFDVFVVLQLDKHIYSSFYNLCPRAPTIGLLYDSSGNLHPREPIPPSFLNSTIQTFLNEALPTLYRPHAARTPQSINTDIREVMRISATGFVGSAIHAVRNPKSPIQNTYTNLDEFFNIFDNVSALNYEGDASMGKIIICDKNHPNLDVRLELATPISLDSFKKVRKLLEMASRDLALWSEGHQILGLGKQHGDYNESSQSLLSIHFSGSRKWKLIHGQHTMLVVEYGAPSLPKPKINEEVFNDLLQRTFDEATPDDLAKIWDITNEAIKQKHGALLVILSDAEGESERLKNQSTKIKPTKLDKSLVRNVTSIDGAVLLDVTGTCYSIGVILDGIATAKGNPERGSRYNSAIRYVENDKNKCVAIIISEDGIVNTYPNLKPRIRRSSIEKYFRDLRSTSTADIVDNDKYRIVMNWLTEHEFYLSLDQCNEINKIKKQCENKQFTDPFAIRILYHDLTPNPEMNNSYFLD